ncbi:MAG: hypothetical protein M3Z64_01045 [Verrucomicrobiota bacterium]|nr:hypothetical protein [Verrucomicrobiota bacterium]
METKLPRPFPLRFVALALACGCCTSALRAADPVAEMASFSVFDKVDLAQLAKSDLKSAHGVPMNNARFASVQSCYVTPGTPAQQIAAMRDWSPLRHPELEVFLHGDVSGGATPATFSKLSSAPDNAAVRALTSATQKPSSDLQISRDEAKKLPVGASGAGVMPASVATFWADLLSARARAFSSGGAGAEAPYDYSGAAIRPGDELRGLLGQQEKIRRQFSGLIESSGIGRGAGSLKPEMYWELLQVEDTGVLTLGASYTKPGPNGSMQAADALFYASGGYYAGLTLYQLWPIDVGGRPSTLVWRGDMISAASLAGLHGIERVASESQMMKDISRAVTFFRRDTSGGR